MTSDATLAVLIEIRDEIRSTNTRLDQTNTRLDQTNTRLDAVREDLGGRIDQTNLRLDAVREDLAGRIDQTNLRLTEMDVRLSTELIAVAGTVRDVRDLMRERRDDLRPRLARCERDIAVLKRRKG